MMQLKAAALITDMYTRNGLYIHKYMYKHDVLHNIIKYLQYTWLHFMCMNVYASVYCMCMCLCVSVCVAPRAYLHALCVRAGGRGHGWRGGLCHAGLREGAQRGNVSYIGTLTGERTDVRGADRWGYYY